MLLKDVINLFGTLKFIQVGAYDGVSKDPIHDYIIKYNWSGVLIEPNPVQYNKLINNYKNIENLFFENVAVSDTLDTVKLFVIKWDESRTTIMRKNRNVWRKRSRKDGMSKLIVNATRLDKIIEKYDFGNFDFLCIDVEGAELDVLLSMDMKKYRPKIIYYENKHVKMLNLYNDLVKLLKRNDYKIHNDGVNDLAILK